jgi:hypothetical protein
VGSGSNYSVGMEESAMPYNDRGGPHLSGRSDLFTFALASARGRNQPVPHKALLNYKFNTNWMHHGKAGLSI